MSEVVGIVLFALVILFSIAIHEVGHLLPAKKFGVKVTEYMVGFGPIIWSKVKGGTDYGIKAIPLGGYIRMVGMLPPAKGDPEGTARTMTTGRFAAMINDARKASLEEIQPGDENSVFYAKPVHQKIIIMLGGPTMNLILAFILFTAMLVGIGLPQPSLTVGALVACTPSVEQPNGTALPSGNCPTGTQPAPGAAAGLQPGDTIVGIDGQPVNDWDTMTTWIREHGGQEATFTITNNGQTRDVPITIATVTRTVVDAQGNPTDQTTTAGFVGVRPQMEYVQQPITAVPSAMWQMTTASVGALISLPVRLYELVHDTLIGGGERQIDGPVSVVGVSRLGGEVAASDQPWKAKAATFLGLAASLNLFLFLFNLIPILPLDGGHVAGAIYEAIRRFFAKLRGKPDPGPADVAKLLPVAYIVAALLIGMSVIVIWADIVKPITLG